MSASVDTLAGASGAPAPRGGPEVRTLRQDRWWIQPAITFAVLLAFVVYASWAAFQGNDYYYRPDHLLSPFYSPCLTSACPAGTGPTIFNVGTALSPALIILIFPLLFRLTCYYYRRSYYRAIWWSPPSCAVADFRHTYTGETRFPLILQNAHRYAFYFGLILNCFLTYDAVESFRVPGGIGMTLGTVVLCVNAALLWLYSISCHSCRHLCGGTLNKFSEHPIRYRIWKVLTPLNARHMKFAWTSLVFVALTDLYVRLVAAGWIHNPRFF